MLAFPTEWTHQFGANLTTAIPPELGARFRYHERVQPQPSFSAIVERQLATDPDFRVHELGEQVRLVTVEGEYGAWVAIAGTREGGHAMRYIAAVFLDDFATVLDVIAILPHQFSRVERLARELACAQRFEMQRRPRRFFYVPPPGWHGIPNGLVANWYPLDFPKNLTNIVIAPASFHDGDAEAAIAATFAEAAAGLAIEQKVRDHVTSASGVDGAYLSLSGRRDGRAEPIFRELAMYVVAPYAYRMRLETTNEARLLDLREQFRRVAGSFKPLPNAEEIRTGRAFVAPLDHFAHWVS